MRTDSALFAQKNVELAKDPRYVIELAFDAANTVLWYFTSHSDASLPSSGVSGSILGIVKGLSGTSQTLNPDTANASIGNINFSLVDRLSIVTTTLGGQLVLGRSTRKQRVRIYVGYQYLAWADYTLVQTQLVTEIAFSEGAYKFTCQDIQREMRKDIFDQAKTTLALSLDATTTTVEVTGVGGGTAGFSMVAHGTSYSDATSATVGYIKIEDEVIRYAGKTSTQFTGCTRGALNTRAVAHTFDASLIGTADDRLPAVTEYVYLELPAIDLMYRLLTGKDRFGASVLPATWNLGIATSYVRLADFTGIGADLWDTADDLQGFLVRFEDLGKTDGKKFIETELALLCGVFMPIYSDGALGCKRMANILSGAAYTGMLDERNLVSWGDLVHDFGALHNIVQISWNWEPGQKDFTRINVLVDAASIATHGRSDPLNLKFRGLHGSRHSREILAQRFDALRDRFTGPPLRLDVSALPSLNTTEVGDVKRVRVQNVRDFTAPGGGGPLDRSFEVQNIQIDWITGALKKKLFASSQAPGPVAPVSTVLNSTWRTGTGTALSSVLTITGSNPGHVSASGSLAGNADMNAAGAIYYYDGDLQIDSGVTISISNNVQLRTKFFQNNGKIVGKGAGLPAAAVGVSGFIGSTEAGGGLVVQPPVFGTIVSNRGTIVAGRNAAVPLFKLDWDGTTLRGLPSDLRGTSGSTGNQVTGRFGAVAAGGVGGAGGAGLAIVCNGFAQGANGSIDLSGADGTSGSSLGDTGGIFQAGSGAGGAGGGLLILLDTNGATATGLTDVGFVSLNGLTPIGPGQCEAPTGVTGRTNYYSFFPGTGDGTQRDLAGNLIPVPSQSDSRGGSRVQPVPKLAVPIADPPQDDVLVVYEELQISNLTLRTNPKNFALRGVASNGKGTLVAVGDADGGDAYILRSVDGGLSWTEIANAKNVRLNAIAYSPSLGMWAAVGNGDGTNSYILTSVNDGVSFTERDPTVSINVALLAICWAPGLALFVAVGVSDGVDSYILTSSNGTTWTERASPVNSQLNGVAYSPQLNRLVAVGEPTGAGPFTGLMLYSNDGMTWTRTTVPTKTEELSLRAVAWVGSAFVAVGEGEISADAYILRSETGVTAVERANPIIDGLSAIATSGVLAYARGSYSTISSRDFGRTWRAYDQDASGGMDTWGLCWDGKRYVGVGGALGSEALIMTSLAR